MRILQIILTTILILTIVNTADAQVETVNDIIKILNRLIDWMFTILLVLATIFILLAAYKYLIAGGNPETIKEANRMILYAAIAIAIGMLSRGIEFLVKQLIG